MSIIFVNVVIIVSIVSTSAQIFESQNNFIPDQTFIDLSQEYVNLHLVDDFAQAVELSKNPKGRNWLNLWNKKKYDILAVILLYQDSQKGTTHMHLNWRERLQRFQDIQKEYFQKIVDKYYNYDPQHKLHYWPKVSFDLESGKTILQPNQPELKNNFNPIITDDEVNELMKTYHPLRNVERKSINKENINLRNYDVFDKKLMDDLRDLRFNLIRESLKGKRMSDLYYQAILFLEERVTAQLSFWTRENLNYDLDQKNEHYYSHFFSENSQKLLTNDDAYKEYLNFDFKYFPGNTFEGPKNRLDDPSKFKLGFEVTSERVLGKRFKPMYNLYREINDYKTLTRDFTQCVTKDLLVIDSMLESFKFWTFWFSKQDYLSKQWIQIENSKSEIYVIQTNTRNSKYVSNDEVLKKVSKIINKEKNPSVLEFDSIFEISYVFQSSLSTEINSVKMRKHKKIPWSFVWTNRINSFFNSMNQAQFNSLTSKIPYRQLLSSKPLQKSSEYIIKNTNKESLDKKFDVNNVQKEKDVTFNGDEYAVKMKQNLDVRSDLLTLESDKNSFNQYQSSNNYDPTKSDFNQHVHYGQGGDSDVYNYNLNHFSPSNSNDDFTIKRRKHFK